MRSLKITIFASIFLLWNASLIFSQQQDSVAVSLPSNAYAKKDSSVSIPVIVGDLTGRGVTSYEMEISFDENVLRPDTVLNEGTLTAQWPFPPTTNIMNPDRIPGTIKVGNFGPALSDAGTLVILDFDVVGGDGNMTDLIFESFEFNGGDVPSSPKNGKFTVSDTAVTSVENLMSVPQSIKLRQNYPNPFNPETRISFDVPTGWTAPLTLQIFNLQGHLVKTILKEQLLPGTYSAVWSGRDSRDKPVASGFYIYQITSDNLAITKKMLLLR